MLALVRLVVFALVASFGTASGALAHPAKPALRALGSSDLIASAISASKAAECVGKLGLHVRHARQDQRLGQYEDAETGLYYNRFRYYDPEAGQYASQDPIGLEGGAALYGYVPDPLSWQDALGLKGCRSRVNADNYPRDFVTDKTKNFSAYFASQREARSLARTKLGHKPVRVEAGKLRSRDGRWQYRSKPEDLRGHGPKDGPHIHLERLDPETGEVLENWHLRW